MIDFSVQGKVAIVTGAGSGINYEFAKLLLSNGCNVIIGDLTLLEAAQELVDAHTSISPRAIFQKTDVTDWTQLSRLFELAEEEFGDLHLVCPGAGIFEPPFSNFWSPPGSSSSKDPTSGFGHYKTLDINLTHPIRMTQLAISHFLYPPSGDASKKASASNPKRVLHIASTASEIATLPYPVYVATKWGVSGFVRSLASLEPEVGIRVNAIAPGMVQTPLWTEHELSKMGPKKKDQLMETMAEEQPAIRWITPADVARSMLRMVQEGDMVGGTVLELTDQGERAIPLFGNTGPPTLTGSRSRPVHGDVYERLEEDGWGRIQPVMEERDDRRKSGYRIE